jgi:hypothetical protein
MAEPDPTPDEVRDDPQDDHLDVAAQYGGGRDWETAPTGLLRGWWKRLRGE